MRLPFGKTKDAQAQDEPGSQDAPAEASASSPKPKLGFWKSIDWKLMAALLFPVTLETLDYTVVATAQSRIAVSITVLAPNPLIIHASYIGTSYLLASTVFLPLFASVADIYGRHFGLQLSLLFFLIGSAISTGAVNMSMILAGRGIAGIGAAGLLTIVRTVLSDTTNPLLFLLYAVGFSVGPVIGGLLVTVSFRWVFAINLPCTALAMILCFLFLRNRSRVPGANDDKELQSETPSPRRTPVDTVDTWISKLALIDWVGTFLFVSGGILVLLALNWGPDDNWKSARVIANLILGVLLIVLCLLWEILLEHRPPTPSSSGTDKSEHVQMRYTGIFRARPMLPIELFTSYDMCVVQYGSFISGIVMFVMFYFVAIFATVVTGLPPAQAGIQLLYFAPGLGAGSLLSIRIIKLLRQPIYPIVFGNAILTVGVGLIQLAMEHNIQGQVNGFMAMVGVGVGLTAGPLAIHARFTKPNHVAITNAMLLFFRAFGGTVGLAQCFTILSAKVNAYISSQIPHLVETLSPSDLAALVSLLDNGGLTSLTSLAGLPSAVQSVVRDAFRDGVRWGFLSLIPWLGVGCLTSLFLSRIKDSDKEEGAEAEMNTRTGEDTEAAAEVS
ncbi:major facilitator superfamily domain-containing protein [Boletus edulis BED1]|uniref:Major facilitator superfamily domain-containing protein n=1 Tax=Boletus edulis BED1 TaxID=1328754 RepID=A0AAD4C9C9_BOLED|nr:major facilitator superfamily domain-containing protein [Boletus edulis BED1]